MSYADYLIKWGGGEYHTPVPDNIKSYIEKGA